MRFSQRIGKKPVRDALQIESMDADLKNSIWNLLHTAYLDGLGFHYSDSSSHIKKFIETLWRDFFKAQLDNIPLRGAAVSEQIKKWLFKAEWYEVYDLLEFTTRFDCTETFFGLEQSANDVLKREVAGYRFVEGVLVPISNEAELAEIEAAIRDSRASSLSGVSEHIQIALAKLSHREQPDYRNSIKESISAVESITKVIANDSSATLGSALKVVEEKVGLHPALKKGFSSIYGYTSDEDGIRHALLSDSQSDFEDAKYMLVSCSAFVNYIIAKASKAGLSLGKGHITSACS